MGPSETRVVVPVFLILFFAGSGAARAGGAQAAKLEAFLAGEDARRAEDLKALRDLAGQCVEKKVAPAVLECLEVLEALAPGLPEWADLRAKAGGLPAPAPAFRSWGSGQTARLKREAAKAWTALMKDAEKQGFRHAAKRCAESLLLFDPKSKDARKALGHVNLKGAWMSEYDASKAKVGVAFDLAWGYVTEERKKNLEAGLRPKGAVWIPKAEEETLARSWNDRVVFDDPVFVLVSNLPFDASLEVHRDLKAALAGLDRFFGDVFGPGPRSWPLTLRLCRTKNDLKAAAAGDEVLEQMAEQMSCFPSESGNTVYCRADGFPEGAPEAYTPADWLRVTMVDWYWAKSSDEPVSIKRPNAFISWGMDALARSRGLLASGKLPRYGCFKHYLEGKSKGQLPPVSELCAEPSG